MAGVKHQKLAQNCPTEERYLKEEKFKEELWPEGCKWCKWNDTWSETLSNGLVIEELGRRNLMEKQLCPGERFVCVNLSVFYAHRFC